MIPLQKQLDGYIHAMNNYYPDDGEVGPMNATRRYLGGRLDALSASQKNKLFDADRLVYGIAQKAREEDSWEQDEINDLVDYIEQEQATRHAA